MSDAAPSGSMTRVEEARRRYNLIGGLMLAVAGLVLLSTSFLLHNPVPLSVRAAVIVFAAAGIAISAGLVRVQNPQDVYGGMALILLALGVVVSGFLVTGPDISAYKIRGVIFIIGSILAFAACIRPLGLVVAS